MLLLNHPPAPYDWDLKPISAEYVKNLPDGGKKVSRAYKFITWYGPDEAHLVQNENIIEIRNLYDSKNRFQKREFQGRNLMQLPPYVHFDEKGWPIPPQRPNPETRVWTTYEDVSRRIHNELITHVDPPLHNFGYNGTTHDMINVRGNQPMRPSPRPYITEPQPMPSTYPGDDNVFIEINQGPRESIDDLLKDFKLAFPKKKHSTKATSYCSSKIFKDLIAQTCYFNVPPPYSFYNGLAVFFKKYIPLLTEPVPTNIQKRGLAWISKFYYPHIFSFLKENDIEIIIRYGTYEVKYQLDPLDEPQNGEFLSDFPYIDFQPDAPIVWDLL